MTKQTQISIATCHALVVHIMMTKTKLFVYEYYDGVNLKIDDEEDYSILLTGENDDEIVLGMQALQKFMFELLPISNLQRFQYETRFPSEIEFSCFKGVSPNLKELYLENFRGVDWNKYKDQLHKINFCSTTFFIYLDNYFANTNEGNEFFEYNSKLQNLHRELMGPTWYPKVPDNDESG